MCRRVIAALATALALSAPPLALAQSVGDEQYRDPFAGEEQPQDETGGGSTGGGGGTTPTPTPAPAPAPAPTSTAPTESSAVEPTATVADTLPRTGDEPAWVAAVAMLLIAAGAGLRRTATLFLE
jgi:LPXTG-motif cell wall-anchored protein